jgi:hypothetical protein
VVGLQLKIILGVGQRMSNPLVQNGGMKIRGEVLMLAEVRPLEISNFEFRVSNEKRKDLAVGGSYRQLTAVVKKLFSRSSVGYGWFGRNNYAVYEEGKFWFSICIVPEFCWVGTRQNL